MPTTSVTPRSHTTTKLTLQGVKKDDRVQRKLHKSEVGRSADTSPGCQPACCSQRRKKSNIPPVTKQQHAHHLLLRRPNQALLQPPQTHEQRPDATTLLFFTATKPPAQAPVPRCSHGRCTAVPKPASASWSRCCPAAASAPA